jgi:hypothetical protein
MRGQHVADCAALVRADAAAHRGLRVAITCTGSLLQSVRLHVCWHVNAASVPVARAGHMQAEGRAALKSC